MITSLEYYIGVSIEQVKTAFILCFFKRFTSNAASKPPKYSPPSYSLGGIMQFIASGSITTGTVGT